MKKLLALLTIVVILAAFAAGLSGCEKADIPDIPQGGAGDTDGETTSVKISFYSDGTLYGIALCTEDGAFAMPKDPEKEGYSFVGWFYEKELITPFVYEEFIASENKTDISLYAAWNKIDKPLPPDGGDGGDEGENPDGDGDGEDGGDETPEEPEVKTYTVTFVMDGQVIATQKVEEGKDAVLPLSQFAAVDNVLYTLVAEGNYTAVSKDETVTLSLRKATEEEYGLFTLSYLTLLIKNGKLYVSVVSAAYPLDRIILPSQWGNFAIEGIKAGAFSRVPQIKSVKAGKYCTDIEWTAFDDLTMLESVEFDEENPAYSSEGLFVTDATGKEVITYLGEDVEELIIPDGMTAIKDGALEGFNITSLIVPEGLSKIGDRAFAGCAYLESVVLPDSVTHIGSGAFENCAALTVLPVPHGVTYLGDGAFAGCANAVTVDYRAAELSALVKDNRIFDGAGSVSGLVLNVAESVESIPARLFDATGAGQIYLKGISFAENCAVTYIGAEAFKATAIQRVVIPSAVTYLGRDAFAYCASLSLVEYRAANAISQGISGTAFKGAGTDGSTFKVGNEVVSLPDYLLYCLDGKVGFSILVFEEGSLESIGVFAFAGSALCGEVTIPASVTKIGGGAFADTAVTALKAADGNTAFVSDGGVLYSSDRTELIAYPSYKEDVSFAVSDGTAQIAAYAFSGAAYLEEVVISRARVGEFAFYNCKKLADISLSEGVEEIKTGAFANCAALSSLVCPSSLRTIGENAFMYCTSLTEVLFNEGLTSIGTRAFAYCDLLGEVEIPSTVTELGDDIFIK